MLSSYYADLRGLYSFTEEGFCSTGGTTVYGDAVASLVFWILLFWFGGELLRVVIFDVIWPLIKKERKDRALHNETDLESK